jgi:hypothetical protein
MHGYNQQYPTLHRFTDQENTLTHKDHLRQHSTPCLRVPAADSLKYADRATAQFFSMLISSDRQRCATAVFQSPDKSWMEPTNSTELLNSISVKRLINLQTAAQPQAGSSCQRSNAKATKASKTASTW